MCKRETSRWGRLVFWACPRDIGRHEFHTAGVYDHFVAVQRDLVGLHRDCHHGGARGVAGWYTGNLSFFGPDSFSYQAAGAVVDPGLEQIQSSHNP